MPNPIARIRSFWLYHGEWVLLGISTAMALSTGFGLAAIDFQKTVVQIQVAHQKEMDEERKYLRSVIEKKNDDIRQLQGIQGDLARGANETAKSSTDAVKAISESAAAPK